MHFNLKVVTKTTADAPVAAATARPATDAT